MTNESAVSTRGEVESQFGGGGGGVGGRVLLSQDERLRFAHPRDLVRKKD